LDCFTCDSFSWKEEFAQREVQRIVNFFSGDEWEKFLNDLGLYSSTVRMLKLPTTLLRNIFQSKSISIGRLLRLFPALEHLDISDGVVEEIILRDILKSIPEFNKNLESLVLRNIAASNKMLRRISSFLKQFPLESLDITENYFLHKGIIEFAHVLRNNSSLKCLTLNSNQFRLDNQRIRTRRLPHWQQLEVQQLERVNEVEELSDEEIVPLSDCKYAADALFQSLGENQHLRLLDIGYNEICLSDIELASWESLQSNTCIHWLLLQGCSINFQNDFNFFEYLPQSVEYLDISKLEQMDSDRLCADLFAATHRLTNLVALDISHNFLSPSSLRMLLSCFANLPSLQSVNLTRCTRDSNTFEMIEQVKANASNYPSLKVVLIDHTTISICP